MHVSISQMHAPSICCKFILYYKRIKLYRISLIFVIFYFIFNFLKLMMNTLAPCEVFKKDLHTLLLNMNLRAMMSGSDCACDVISCSWSMKVRRQRFGAVIFWRLMGCRATTFSRETWQDRLAYERTHLACLYRNNAGDYITCSLQQNQVFFRISFSFPVYGLFNFSNG